MEGLLVHNWSWLQNKKTWCWWRDHQAVDLGLFWFREIQDNYFKLLQGCSGIVFSYDITNGESFTNLMKTLMSEIDKHLSENFDTQRIAKETYSQNSTKLSRLKAIQHQSKECCWNNLKITCVIWDTCPRLLQLFA